MEKHIPYRMCVGCRKMKPAHELLRIVKNLETSEVELDLDKKKFGRGAYICCDRSCFETAVKKKAFERSFKGKMRDIYDKILHEIEISEEHNEQ